MTRKYAFYLSNIAGLVLIALTGCGGSGQNLEKPPPSGPGAPNAPSLLSESKSPGEFLFYADHSPKEFRPVTLKGRYLVRFAQYAPEDPNVNFGSQTIFLASLVRVSGKGPKAIPLFQNTARTGRTKVTANGRYVVDVSFGDFPFVIRFTPA